MARRKLVWARSAPAMTSLAVVQNTPGGAVETQDLLQTFRQQAGLLAGPVGLTVVRVRMSIHAYFNTAGTFAEFTQGFGLYYGIRTYDTADLAQQEATERVDQGPMLDPHADWMAWGRVMPKAAVSTAPFALGWADVDVRSMRKFDELGMTLGLAVQTTSAASLGTAVSTVLVSTSCLLALP